MDLIKEMFGVDDPASAGGAKSDRAKKAAGGQTDEQGRRRRRDRDYDRITAISIPRYHMQAGHVEYIVEVRKAGVAWQVSRRYQQFKKLHADLTSLCPMTTPYHCEHGVVPVLCGSSWTEVTNQSVELVERRRRFLTIYLEQLLVSKNKFYQRRTALYDFLHEEEVALDSQPGQVPLPGLGAGGGALDSLPAGSAPEDETPHGVAAALGIQLTPPASGPIPVPTQRMPIPSGGGGGSQPGEGIGSMGRSVPAPSYVSLVADTREPPTSSPAISPKLPDAPAAQAPLSSTADIFERCVDCGRMEVVDYPVLNWEHFGPCDTCLRYTNWELVRQVGDTKPERITRDTALSLQQSGEAAVALHHLKLPSSNCAAGSSVGPSASEQAKSDADAAASPRPAPPVDADAADSRPRCGSTESQRGRRPKWRADADVKQCEMCGDSFSFFLRKHHCRRCGGIFCGHCAKYTAALPALGFHDEVRVCKGCKRQVAEAEKDESVCDGESSGVGSPHTTPAPRPMNSKDVIPLAGEQPVTQISNDGGDSGDASHVPTSVGGAGLASVVEHGDLAGVLRQRELQPSDFELITTLGKGTFGKVMKVAFKETGATYAMKVLSKRVVAKRKMVKYIREEKEILSTVRHPFIVALHASFQTEHHLYLILEFLPGGELYTHIYHQGRFGEADARFYTAELASALAYLHSLDVVHRDIKPENIVLDREGHAMLTDFGLAKAEFSSEQRRSFVGSAEYLAPETIKGLPQTCAVDWWAFGVMLFEMLAGVAPFNGTNSNDVYQQVLHKEINFGAAKIHSAEAISLLRGILRKDLRQRLVDPDKIKAHPFYGTIDWDALLERRVCPPFVPDLEHNDTRYFSREFTHEWARIPDCGPAPASAADGKAAEQMAQKFDNFPVAGSVVQSAVAAAAEKASADDDSSQNEATTTFAGKAAGINLLSATAIDEFAMTPQFSAVAALGPHSSSLPGRTPEEVAMFEHQQLMRDFCGEWSLRSLEVVAQDGKISYPWGPDAVGQMLFTTHGLFSMQLASPRTLRPPFRDPDYKKVTREEMAEAYIGYVAFFGSFTHTPGRAYISQHIQASLCPNWTGSIQKRFFSFCNSQNQPDRDQLILTTSPIGVEGEAARTVMRFERFRPGQAQVPPMCVRRPGSASHTPQGSTAPQWPSAGEHDSGAAPRTCEIGDEVDT
eukprot:TRINITY_DN2736_c0_g2_i1.p1 TRINITY_DN2736_c0_g2~~TRINITY_DN2736_c0_g2_i1.p1  ORF type:complete len:1218 (+),score=345.82 TRINITY_DN2736_c0_g2_i1:102-3656(+)